MKTTKEKITDVFRALRKQGIVAKQSFSCCQSCARYELAEAFDGAPASSRAKMKGCVFYTRQDAPVFRTGGTLYLRYGQLHGDRNGDSELTTMQVGEIVVEALRQHGLDPRWDGKDTSAIEVEVQDVRPRSRRRRWW